MARRYRKKQTLKKKIDKIERQMPKPELAFVHAQATQITIGQAPTKWLLNGLVPGDLQGTRDKMKIKMKYVNIDYLVQWGDVPEHQAIRIIVAMDKEAHGATIANADFFVDITPIDMIVSPVVIQNLKRYNVLRDITLTGGATSSPATAGKFRIPLNHIVQYNAGVSGTITDIEKNSLLLMAVSTEAVYNPEVTFFSRIGYYDN